MKKTRKFVLGFMLVFAMAFMVACGSDNNETTMGSTTAPTTKVESTGVIDGMADDVKDGAEDVKDGVEDAFDMTNGTDTGVTTDSTSGTTVTQ